MHISISFSATMYDSHVQIIFIHIIEWRTTASDSVAGNEIERRKYFGSLEDMIWKKKDGRNFRNSYCAGTNYGCMIWARSVILDVVGNMRNNRNCKWEMCKQRNTARESFHQGHYSQQRTFHHAKVAQAYASGLGVACSYHQTTCDNQDCAIYCFTMKLSEISLSSCIYLVFVNLISHWTRCE